MPLAISVSFLRARTPATVLTVLWGMAIASLVFGAENRPAQATPPIASAAEIDYPPFSIVGENGRADGFSVELMRAALAAMGREVTFRTGPWAEVRDWLERGEIDALPMVGRTPEREALFDFTVPYMSLHGAIVVRGDETGIRDLSDLRGRQVAVMKGDNAEEFLRREERGFDIRTTPTFEVAFQELAEGRHDAVVTQRLVALRLIQKTGLTDLRVIDTPIEGFRQDFCFAVHEGDRDTLALLNEGLAIVAADGTYRHLHAKWFAAMQMPTDRPIVVGGDRNFPPFEFLDENGRPAGYNVDLTRAIAREMGLNVEIRLGRWLERMEALKTGKIDVMQGMFYSPGRDLNFDFTQAHTVSHYVAVVRKGEGPAPDGVDALRGKRIMVEGGDIMQDFALENGLAEQVTLVDDQEAALRELSEGRHDCALVSRVTALYLIDKHGWTNLELEKNPLLASEYGYAAAKGQKALLAQFSEGLKALENSGEYRRIYEKWLGVYKEEPLSLIRALRYSAMVLIPLALLLLGFFLWSWFLRKEVFRRTTELAAVSGRHQAMLAAVPDIIMEVDVDKIYTWANPAAYAFFGEDVIGREAADYFAEEQDTYNKMQPLFDGHDNVIYVESWQRRRDGEKRLLAWWSRVRKDQKGNVIGALSTARDITAQKQTEEALQRSEEQYRLLVENQTDLVVKVDPEGRFLFVSPSYCRMFGKKEAELLGRQFIPLVHEADRGPTEAAMKALFSPPHTAYIEQRAMTKNGWLWLAWVDTAVLDDQGNVAEIIGLGRDITDRKQDQLRIDHLNQVLRAIRDVNQLIVRERDRDRLIREGCRLLVGSGRYPSALIVLTDDRDRPVTWAMEGLAADSEELATLLEQGVLPACCGHASAAQGVLLVDDRDRVCGACPIAETCAESQSLCAPLTHEGETFGYLAAAGENHLVVDEEERGLFGEMAGDFAYALSVIRIEAAHRESESRFRSIVENAPEPIFIQTEMRFAYLNPKAIDLFGGKDARELLETPVMDRFHPDYHENIHQRIKTLNDDRRPVKELLELKFLRLDGSSVWVETTGQPIVYHGKNGALVFVRDITVRKRNEQERDKLQAQLIQAQKMESVGRLAGGVAHDYNNMLSVIIGFTELAMEKTAPDGPLHEDLTEVLGAARRSADITRQLLAFARRQTIDPQAIDLNETVEEMLKMLRRLIGEDIDLAWRPGPGRMPVFMDPSQLDQLLANLCVNARDAIAGVGRLTIETGHVRFDADYCADHAGFIPGNFMLLAVSDDGCGMDKDTLDKIFEPFFTTKEVGRGTGLGLATVFGIVKQNDGFINVYSEPGRGTTFKIYLPPHAEDDAGIKAEETTEIPAGHGETVLIVEDEAPVLKLAQRILAKLGYTVLTAPTPGKGIALVEAHRSAYGDAQAGAGNIHLLVTDVVMPEMNGRKLAEHLQTHYPDLKVLFMSGYTANVIAHRGVLDEGVHFIQKPFSNRDLAVKVREALAD